MEAPRTAQELADAELAARLQAQFDAEAPPRGAPAGGGPVARPAGGASRACRPWPGVDTNELEEDPELDKFLEGLDAREASVLRDERFS